jgi:signal transduction histidine kinase
MKEMIAALLTLARTESIGSNAEVFEISEVAESAVTQSAQVAGTSGVDIVNQVEEGLFVHGNQSLLTRALRNILDNGIKASRAGSRVHLRGFRDGTYVRLEIEDEGFGIEPDDLEKIFEPFYQVDKARTPGDSHGLGLAICRRIIAAHGGTVTAESTGGNGACFQIRLPAVEGTQSQYPTVNEESRST